MDTLKSKQEELALLGVQVELERTRALLRDILECLLDDGFTFHRESPLSEWWNEELRRPTVKA